MESSNLPGFDPRVQNQLAQISRNQRGRTNSDSSRSSLSSSSQRSRPQQYSTHIHPRNPHYSQARQDTFSQPPQAPPGLDAFPPLTATSASLANMPQSFVQPTSTMNQNYSAHGSAQRSQSAVQFFNRARGQGRGRARDTRQPGNMQTPNSSGDYSRPYPPQNHHANNPNAAMHFGSADQQRMNRQRMIEQSDFLNFVASESSKNMLSRQEIREKQDFSETLESLARQVILTQDSGSLATTSDQVRLQPYGSLANSFGTTGCDVDLLLTIKEARASFVNVPERIKRDLEKVLLDQGFGARLLTNTRVPIIRVCQKPSAELLKDLRGYRLRWEMGELEPEKVVDSNQDFDQLPNLTSDQEQVQTAALASLDLNAAAVALPESPIPDHAKLEYVGDCGIQCDINFTNHVALYNSKLLWTYGQCDARVRLMGIFVKNWAKARDINTPYRGTLSSYGYILMVLHYLINVARPPLLPNLQELAKDNGWAQMPTELFEGHDIRFTHDRNVIQQAMAQQPNRTSLGGLLHGFFRYYATPSGFRWLDEVISIRTPAGIVSKQEKGWTKAKWAEENQNVRQRYLLAIEDPFEVDHNVGRTVGHNGIVAIRNEFRRAFEMIEGVQRVPSPQGPTWIWVSRDQSLQGDGLDLIKPAENKGDLLRKDADGRKEKYRLRQELEAKEKLAMKQTLQGDGNETLAERTGMLRENENLDAQINTVEDTSELIRDVQHQDEKVTKMRSRNPARQRVDDTDEDDHNNDDDDDDVEILAEKVSNAPDTNTVLGLSTNWSTNENGDVQTALVVSNIQWDEHQQTITNAESQSLAQEQQPPEIPNRHDPYVFQADLSESLSWECEEQAVNDRNEHNCVGPEIQWTTDSKAGLWLLRRDKFIRAGNWKHPTAGDKARLSARFAYDPFMTNEELAHKNRILEAHYKHTFHPTKAEDIHAQPADTGKILIDVSDDVHDDVWRVSPNDQESPKQEKTIQDWPVGKTIFWSLNTEVGRWLHWRDRRVRDQLWTDYDTAHKDLGQSLSDLFPCDGEKTIANIERMNLELDTFFVGLDYPSESMEDDERHNAARLMWEAVDRVTAEREDSLEGQRTQLTSTVQVQSESLKLDARYSRSLVPKFEMCEPASAEMETVTPLNDWDPSTDLGSWLRRRDALTRDGLWRPTHNLDNIFSKVSNLFPQRSTLSKQEQDRMDQEIARYFTKVSLPRKGESAADAYAAFLRVVEHRKDHAEADRVESLLNIFEDKTMKDLKEARGKPAVVGGHSQEEINERSIRAIKAISDQLSKPNDDLADYVRKQRLAFFERQENKTSDRDGGEEVFGRRDSAVEGSWNNPPSPSSSLDPAAILSEHLADCPKFSELQFRPAPSADLCSPGMNNDPATTDESGGEVIPATLQPGTWRTDPAHRHENPQVMPFPRMLGFSFDLRQLADIQAIRAGGNGCARNGQSPYTFESDLHSWGGGGAMAQRSESFEWSYTGCMYNSTKSVCSLGVKENELKELKELFGQLPSSDLYSSVKD